MMYVNGKAVSVSTPVPIGAVDSVNGKTGDVTLTGDDIALSDDDSTKVSELKQEIENAKKAASSKVDKIEPSQYTRVYAVEKSGNHVGINMRVAAVGDAIVQRDANGQIQGVIPTKDSHLTRKDYVDNAIEELRSLINKLSIRIAYLEGDGETDYEDGGNIYG
jgi:hypothetical protein